MKIKTDIATLERAGSEHSAWLNKVRKSIDNLADYLIRILPDQTTHLPDGYQFTYWPSKDYSILKQSQSGGGNLFELTRQSKNRESVLAFTREIASGFLDKLSKHLEYETGQFLSASDKIKQLVEK